MSYNNWEDDKLFMQNQFFFKLSKFDWTLDDI